MHTQTGQSSFTALRGCAFHLTKCVGTDGQWTLQVHLIFASVRSQGTAEPDTSRNGTSVILVRSASYAFVSNDRTPHSPQSLQACDKSKSDPSLPLPHT